MSMSQSPIKMASFNKKSKALDALPLANPQDLFSVHYRPGVKAKGTFEGDEHHEDLLISSKRHYVTFRGDRYDLKKIHIHSESEHIVETDDPLDLEIHLVHAPAGSSVASPLVVIGILFRIAGPNDKVTFSASLGSLLSNIHKKTYSLDPSDFFPAGPKGHPITTEWFHYEGSLTSFPYSENVSWFVMRKHGYVTADQVEVLRENAEQYARELQPLNRRLVVRSF